MILGYRCSSYNSKQFSTDDYLWESNCTKLNHLLKHQAIISLLMPKIVFSYNKEFSRDLNLMYFFEILKFL